MTVSSYNGNEKRRSSLVASSTDMSLEVNGMATSLVMKCAMPVCSPESDSMVRSAVWGYINNFWVASSILARSGDSQFGSSTGRAKRQYAPHATYSRTNFTSHSSIG